MSGRVADAIGFALVVAIVASIAGACRTPPPTPDPPGLGEIMTFTQMRHIKLWFAGRAENWPLADYELDELEEGFADAVHFHPTHKGAPRPLTELVPEFTEPALRRLRSVVADRDAASFAAAFDTLTDGCNGCHRVAGFGFNVVSRPSANPYSNQEFRSVP